ncbi:hypothetical protein EGH21_13195 [Halomicroarcula sp. F13]|uniref:Gas vesicle protein n=1 Tax=Haloarcula rubra TaxID=2487747 RepID=A0AAW4PSL5_9EURY|nr:hypothetical protein [Halomicroarcula rubra]MBX0323988.1 hypothetical protein [Halomicroarcula rubra]
MEGTVDDADTAEALARTYADEECVGELGAEVSVERTDGGWVVEFRTHTFSDTYEHRIRITTEGNVFGHERSSRFD